MADCSISQFIRLAVFIRMNAHSCSIAQLIVMVVVLHSLMNWV